MDIIALRKFISMGFYYGTLLLSMMMVPKVIIIVQYVMMIHYNTPVLRQDMDTYNQGPIIT